jgi:hypothetical protein
LTTLAIRDRDARVELDRVNRLLLADLEAARTGRCDACFYNDAAVALNEWCVGDSESDIKTLHADCWRVR